MGGLSGLGVVWVRGATSLRAAEQRHGWKPTTESARPRPEPRASASGYLESIDPLATSAATHHRINRIPYTRIRPARAARVSKRLPRID